MLEDEEVDEKWWVIWVGAITTLRSIGDVLKNIDGKEADGTINLDGQMQEQLFREKWMHDPMFSDFIKPERDLLVHEAQSNTSEGPSFLGLAEGEIIGETFEMSADLFRPIRYGHMEGEDARDAYRTAITWWQTQIAELKTELV